MRSGFELCQEVGSINRIFPLTRLTNERALLAAIHTGILYIQHVRLALGRHSGDLQCIIIWQAASVLAPTAPLHRPLPRKVTVEIMACIESKLLPQAP